MRSSSAFPDIDHACLRRKSWKSTCWTWCFWKRRGYGQLSGKYSVEGDLSIHSLCYFKSTFNPFVIRVCLCIHSNSWFFRAVRWSLPLLLGGTWSINIHFSCHSLCPASIQCLDTGRSICFLRMLCLCPFRRVFMEHVVSPTNISEQGHISK